MRRENSTFKSAFVSHEGSKLFNNDYYGSAELDRFACYVAADGLDPGDLESDSARIAVQAAIAAFHERPSMRKSALKSYVQAAHQALQQNSGHLSMRASIMVVVTDYQKVRYAWAGNTRFYIYRSGRLLHESLDHSLSQQMARRGELPLDKIARHEERDNLARYAGQPGALTPQVAKKIKLQDSDVISLITRGIWESCDSGDIHSAISSAENDPQLALEGLERLLLDPRPPETDNYTAAVIFVDKVYIDPNRSKKIRRIVIISILILVILVALSVILIIMHNRTEIKRQDMQSAYLSAVEYVGDENYLRAIEEIKTSATLAKELKDQDFQAKTDAYQKLVEAVLNAVDLTAAGDYEGAQAAYLLALDRSRYTDNAGKPYIERRLVTLGQYLSIRDLIALGDTLSALGNYPEAEQKYLDARRLASGISDTEGRKLALEALQNLYDIQDRDEATAQATADQQNQTLREAADMEAAGDQAIKDGDLISAKLYYDIAVARFMALPDEASVARINNKLLQLINTQAQIDQQTSAAEQYLTEGNQLYDSGNYVDAKVKYIQARNIFSRLQNEVALADVITKIDQCDAKIVGVDKSTPAEDTLLEDPLPAEITAPTDISTSETNDSGPGGSM